MSDLRDSFKTKDFVVNYNIIKSINSLDISLKEFLLVLYFINVSPLLDTDDIKSKLGMSEDEIVEAFTSLINKKYIELDVSNNKGIVTEKVKLDPLYDRLALSENVNESNNNDIFALFESELGRGLSTFEIEMINDWISKGIEEGMIKDALKEALLNNVRSFKYIDSILYNWTKNGTRKRIREENNKEIFDYNWLDDNE